MPADPTRKEAPAETFDRVALQSQRADDYQPCNDPRGDWSLLLISIALVVAALVVDVNADGALFLRARPDVPFPVVCPLRRFCGISCPACGVTRSAVFLVQGRPAESLAAHRLGWLVLAAIVFQIPYRTWRVAGGRGFPNHPRLVPFALAGFLMLLVLNWLIPQK